MIGTRMILIAALLAVVALWGWISNFSNLRDKAALKAQLVAAQQQAKRTDKVLRERDAQVDEYRRAATLSRLRLQEARGNACTDRPVDPYVSCLLKHATRGHGPDAGQGCAGVERTD